MERQWDGGGACNLALSLLTADELCQRCGCLAREHVGWLAKHAVTVATEAVAIMESAEKAEAKALAQMNELERSALRFRFDAGFGGVGHALHEIHEAREKAAANELAAVIAARQPKVSFDANGSEVASHDCDNECSHVLRGDDAARLMDDLRNSCSPEEAKLRRQSARERLQKMRGEPTDSQVKELADAARRRLMFQHNALCSVMHKAECTCGHDALEKALEAFT